jgi:wyosine [tRNA(Phe)-imidazoG37] synthetase (radical SAM superfamily)
MRPKLFAKVLAAHVPAAWDDILVGLAEAECKSVSTVTREVLLAGFRAKGIDPFTAQRSSAAAPEAA